MQTAFLLNLTFRDVYFEYRIPSDYLQYQNVFQSYLTARRKHFEDNRIIFPACLLTAEMYNIHLNTFVPLLQAGVCVDRSYVESSINDPQIFR